METIYVKLLNEGIDVWKPIKAKRLTENTFLIVDKNTNSDETLEFNVNKIVHLKEKIFSDNKQRLVAYKVVKEN